MLADLAMGYMRRKRWEARTQAIENAKAIAELLGGSSGNAQEGGRRVSADALLGSMGMRL